MTATIRGPLPRLRAKTSGGTPREFAVEKVSTQQLQGGVDPEEPIIWDTPALRDDGLLTTGTTTPDGSTSVAAGSAVEVPAELDGWSCRGLVVTNWDVVNAGVADVHFTDICVLLNDALPPDPGRAIKQDHSLSLINGDSPLSDNDQYQIVVPFYFPNLAAGDIIWTRMRNQGEMLEQIGSLDGEASLWYGEFVAPSATPGS